MIGQITLASENYENMMLSSGKSFLIYDKVDELDAVLPLSCSGRWPGRFLLRINNRF